VIGRGARGGRERTPGDTGLPLTLPPPPALPAGVALEMPVPCSAPFDADDWHFSVDWDGTRALLTAGSGGEARLRDERRREAGDRFPEVLAEVPTALGGHAAVLEGVVTVLDRGGRPDLEALCRRRAGEPGVPAVFITTDLLHLDGVSLLQRPFAERLERLGAAVTARTHLQVPEWVAGDGGALAEAAAGQGLSAIVARHTGAPYRAGVASAQRLRIALEERADAVVTAVVRDEWGRVTALLLGEQQRGRLVDAGWVTVRLPASVARWLERRLGGLVTATPAYPCAVAIPGEVRWLQADLVATVGHEGRLSGGQLRHPRLVALRDDRDPAWCLRRAPLPPPASEERPRGFRPTVLHTLPFGPG
jgi:bifunctional non-homologous end joining protein LigD